MNLERSALIAEIVSGIAIVVTLVILLFEVRGNAAVVRAATCRDIVESLTSILHDRAADPEASEINYAVAAGEQLSKFERNRFRELVTVNTRRFENAFYQYQTGVIDPSQWAGAETALRQVVQPPGIRHCRGQKKGLCSEGFQLRA